MEHTTEASEGATVMPPPIAAVVPGVVIACELPCIHCGYDLRTMRLDGQCPECGKACRDSLRSLALARLDDLTRVRQGMLIVLLAAIAVPALGAVCIGSMLLYEFWVASIANRLGEILSKCVGFGVFVCGPALSAVGVFLLTRPLRREEVEGEQPEVESRRSSFALRRIAIAFAIFAAAAYVFLLGLDAWYWASEAMAWVLGTLLFLAACAGVRRNQIMCEWMRAITLRGNSPRLAMWLRVLWWVSTGMLVYLFLLGCGILLAYSYSDVLGRPGTNNSRPLIAVVMMAFAVFYGIGWIGFLAWIIMWAGATVRFDALLRSAKRMATARGAVVERPVARTQACAVE